MKWITIISLFLEFSIPSMASGINPCSVSRQKSLQAMVPFDGHQIAKRIESGELTLSNRRGEDVSKVEGLPRGEDYFVRFARQDKIPTDIEIKKLGFDFRTRPRREYAMYLLSRELGLNHVPPVQFVKINGIEATIQVKAKGTEFRVISEEYGRKVTANLGEDPIKVSAHKLDLEELAVLDMIGGSMDRHNSNFLYDFKKNHIWAFDNADVLPLSKKSPSLVWFWKDQGKVLKFPLERKIKKLIQNVNVERLSSILESNRIEVSAIEAMKSRVNFMKIEIERNPSISMQELGEAVYWEFIDMSHYR